MSVRPAPRATSRAAGIGLWTLQIVLAAVLLFSAYGKLTGDPTNTAGFAAMGMGSGGMFFVGLVEVAGAIGLLIPLLRGLAATCLVVHMALATILTVISVGGLMVLIPAVVLVLVAIVAWGRRNETVALVARVTGRGAAESRSRA